METVGGHSVAGGAGDPVYEALETKPPQVVGHLAGRVGGFIEAEQPGDVRAQVAVAEALWQIGEAAERVEQRHGPRVTETQARRTAADFDGGSLQAVECFLCEGAGLTNTLGLEQLAVDLCASSAQVGQVRQPFPGVEVAGVVDGGLGAQGSLLLEVLFNVGMLVLDVQTGIHAVGDHPSPIAVRRSGRGFGELCGKEQAHPIGPAQIEVLPDQFFEEVPALNWVVEHLGEAHLQLPDGQAVAETSGAVFRCEWPGQPLHPAVEESLHLLRTQRIADRLQTIRVFAREKPIIEALEGDPALSWATPMKTTPSA